jgi:hypothetical protein
VLTACGSTASSPASSGGGGAGASSPAGTSQPPAATEPADASESTDGEPSGDAGGPIGGDIGDRSKGSIQAQISGGLTASVDLPYAAVLARLLVDGPNTAYLPFTDPDNGTLFLTVTQGGLLVQYAGPDQTGLTSAGTPCELHLDKLDGSSAKGSFTCKAMMLVKSDGTIGTADMTATFEGHQ